jgi:hypothetical protein
MYYFEVSHPGHSRRNSARARARTHARTHTPTQTTKPIKIGSTYVTNGFHYSIPLVILYIRSETSNWKLDLNRDSTLETKTHNEKTEPAHQNTL